jgi:hypothetical protein
VADHLIIRALNASSCHDIPHSRDLAVVYAATDEENRELARSVPVFSELSRFRKALAYETIICKQQPHFPAPIPD